MTKRKPIVRKSKVDNPISTEQRTKDEPKEVSPEILQRRNMKALCSTEAGVKFLKQLMATCGYQRTSVDVNTSNEVIMNNMIYNEARRDIWLRIRALVPRDALIKIEIPDVEVDKDVGHGTGDFTGRDGSKPSSGDGGDTES